MVCRCCTNLKGAPIGRRPVSLRFQNVEQELGFLKIRYGKMMSSTVTFVLLYSITVTYMIAVILRDYLQPNREKHEGQAHIYISIWMAQVACLSFCVFLALVLIAFCLIPQIHMKFTNASQEIIIILFVSAAMCINVVAIDRATSIRLFGGVDASTFGPQACLYESLSVFVIAVFVNAMHLLPIRWVFLFVVELTALVLQAALVSFHAAAGIPITSILTHSGLLAVVVFISLLGKRSHEVDERNLFVELAKERTLRCEAQFRLDQSQVAKQSSSHLRQNNKYDCISEANSLATSAASKLVFDQLASASAAPDLSALFNLGLQEHWLIRTQDVKLLPSNILGAGSFGLVVTATFHGAKVAVKLPRSALQANLFPNFSDTANELRVLRQCRHPNLVQFYGVLLDPLENCFALVLEFITGHSLHVVMRQPSTSLTVFSRYDLILSSCRALCYLHSRAPKIVHGDLSSGNMLVERKGDCLNVKLTDFGLSRILTRNVRLLGGTLVWMAPEVYRRELPKPSSDVFSFGRLMFFIATGAKPFHDSDKRSIKQILRSAVLPPLSWPGVCSIEDYCKAIVENCSQVRESSRLSIEEVRAQIEAWPIDSAMVTPKDATDWQDGIKGLKKQLFEQKEAGRLTVNTRSDLAQEDPLALVSICESSSPDEKTTRLGLPGFRPTPREIQIVLVTLAMHSLNPEVDEPCCCLFHAALRVVVKICKDLRHESCKNTFYDDICSQCVKCGVFDIQPAEPECWLCGEYQEPPVDSRHVLKL